MSVQEEKTIEKIVEKAEIPLTQYAKLLLSKIDGELTFHANNNRFAFIVFPAEKITLLGYFCDYPDKFPDLNITCDGLDLELPDLSKTNKIVLQLSNEPSAKLLIDNNKIIEFIDVDGEAGRLNLFQKIKVKQDVHITLPTSLLAEIILTILKQKWDVMVFRIEPKTGAIEILPDLEAEPAFILSPDTCEIKIDSEVTDTYLLSVRPMYFNQLKLVFKEPLAGQSRLEFGSLLLEDGPYPLKLTVPLNFENKRITEWFEFYLAPLRHE